MLYVKKATADYRTLIKSVEVVDILSCRVMGLIVVWRGRRKSDVVLPGEYETAMAALFQSSLFPMGGGPSVGQQIHHPLLLSHFIPHPLSDEPEDEDGLINV